jgi:hypothetical protein
MWYNGGPLTLALGRIHYYTTTQQICQDFLRKKIKKIFFPKLLTFCARCDIIDNVRRAREKAPKGMKKILRNFQKPIDKLNKV